ncbi:Lpg1974 family pore-forming outer membrane protein [Parvibaculum sp.]|uniref:Lpg1974 family pore-forming outer membrane protein n=1 Tax=Parvibaculum sp. TaxID=2024848 RepID=UPI00320C9B95
MTKSSRALLLCGVAAAALSAAAGSASASGGKETNWATVDNYGFLGLDLTVEGGYLFGSGDLPYAQYYDGAKDYSFDTGPGDGWTGKVGLTGRFEGGWDVNLFYSRLKSSESTGTASYDASNTPVDWPVWNILGWQSHSTPSGATSYNSATVTTDLTADIVDLNVGYDVGLGSGSDGKLKLIGGLRYAAYTQTTSMNLFCSASVFIPQNDCIPARLEVAQHRESRYRGFGPQFGANYSAPLSDNGLGVFGSLVGSLLYGNQSTNTYSEWKEGDPYSTRTSYNDNHFAYTIDTQAGLSYKLPDQPLEVAAGYQLSWASGVRDSKNEAIATGSNNSFGSRRDDLLYHGPFVRLTVSLP